MFSYKIFWQGSDTLLAIADTSVIGKVLEEGDVRIVVSKEFYGEETCEKARIKALIKSATIINAIGKNIITILMNENIVDKSSVLYIGGVPHAQIITV